MSGRFSYTENENVHTKIKKNKRCDGAYTSRRRRCRDFVVLHSTSDQDGQPDRYEVRQLVADQFRRIVRLFQGKGE